MDAVSLLLIVLFFILPLIQQALERSRRKAPGQSPGEELEERGAEWEEVNARQETPTLERVPGEGERAEGWSESWGSWPRPAPPAPETFDRPAPTPSLQPPPAETLAARYEPLQRAEVVRIGPEIGLARLEPLADLARVSPARRSSKGLRPNPALEGAKPASRGSKLPLRSKAELRQAIVLSEVLGPPLSIRRTVDRE